jgi:hypothetical protein
MFTTYADGWHCLKFFLANNYLADSNWIMQKPDCYQQSGLLVLVGATTPKPSSKLNYYNVPRNSCSRSMASNSALKLPLPKEVAPLRWMISKNMVGLGSTGFVKI